VIGSHGVTVREDHRKTWIIVRHEEELLPGEILTITQEIGESRDTPILARTRPARQGLRVRPSIGGRSFAARRVAIVIQRGGPRDIRGPTARGRLLIPFP
jgi:hypothetical protein